MHALLPGKLLAREWFPASRVWGAALILTSSHWWDEHTSHVQVPDAQAERGERQGNFFSNFFIPSHSARYVAGESCERLPSACQMDAPPSHEQPLWALPPPQQCAVHGNRQASHRSTDQGWCSANFRALVQLPQSSHRASFPGTSFVKGLAPFLGS